MESKSGIYNITNTVNGKVYIGQAYDINKRKRQHFNDLKRNKHRNKHLQSAYNKYGEDSFLFNVILYCEKFELTRYEQSVVDITSNIYNIRKLCVTSALGIKRSEESRRRMSEVHKNPSEEIKRKMSEAHKGKRLSEDAKRKVSEFQKGRITSDETKCKLSESNKGKTRSEETKCKISKAKKGSHPAKWTEERKRKFSEVSKIREANKRLLAITYLEKWSNE